MGPLTSMWKLSLGGFAVAPLLTCWRSVGRLKHTFESSGCGFRLTVWVQLRCRNVKESVLLKAPDCWWRLHNHPEIQPTAPRGGMATHQHILIPQAPSCWAPRLSFPSTEPCRAPACSGNVTAARNSATCALLTSRSSEIFSACDRRVASRHMPPALKPLLRKLPRERRGSAKADVAVAKGYRKYIYIYIYNYI